MSKGTETVRGKGESITGLPPDRQEERDGGSRIAASQPAIPGQGSKVRKQNPPPKPGVLNLAAEAAEEAAWKAHIEGFGKWDMVRVNAVPKKHQKLYRRALMGTASHRGTIKAFCQQCMGWSDLPDSVRDCTARACPSYAKRPYQQPRK